MLGDVYYIWILQQINLILLVALLLYNSFYSNTSQGEKCHKEF